MAQRVILGDDLDGSEGAETLRYTVDGQEYEIDLSTANAEKFRKGLQTYIDKSRPVEAQSPPLSGGRGRSRRSSASGRSREDLSAIRAWAESNGHDVAPRGRIKHEIIEAYDKAHS
jgi:Lsr2